MVLLLFPIKLIDLYRMPSPPDPDMTCILDCRLEEHNYGTGCLSLPPLGVEDWLQGARLMKVTAMSVMRKLVGR